MEKKGFSKAALKAANKRKYVVFDKFSTICDEDGNGTLGAIDSINCTTADGGLSAGVGMTLYYTANDEEVEYDKNVEICQYFTYKNWDEGVQSIGVMAENGAMFYVDEEELPIKIYKNFMHKMDVYNCVDGDLTDIILAVGPAGIFAYREEGEQRSELKRVNCSCICRDRLFVCLDSYVVRYSEPLEYLHFNETVDDSGVLYLPSGYGEPMAMVAYKENVYVLYAYEIVEIKTAGAARDFRMRILPYVGGKIIENGVRVFGDKLLILAEDGIYMFDGNAIKKAYQQLGIQAKKNSRIFNSAVCADKLLIRYVDRNNKDTSAVLYPDGEYGYYATFMSGLGEYRGRVFCVYNNRLYNVQDNSYIPSAESRFFRSVEQNFGILGVKTLKALHFEGKGIVDIDVYVDGVKKTSRPMARFVDGKATLRLDVRGESFSFLFWVATGSEIWRMTAEVEYV